MVNFKGLVALLQIKLLTEAKVGAVPLIVKLEKANEILEEGMKLAYEKGKIDALNEIKARLGD